jgi:ribosomal protein L16 Arg81 hydroxylase
MEKKIAELEIKQKYTDDGIREMKEDLKKLTLKIDQVIDMIRQEASYRREDMNSLENKLREEFVEKEHFEQHFRECLNKHIDREFSVERSKNYKINTIMSVAWKIAMFAGIGYSVYASAIGG